MPSFQWTPSQNSAPGRMLVFDNVELVEFAADGGLIRMEDKDGKTIGIIGMGPGDTFLRLETK